MSNFRNRLESLEELERIAEAEGNLFLPWPEWHQYKAMTPEQKGVYLDEKLRSLMAEILGNEAMTA